MRLSQRQRRRRCLVFSPLAYLKLQYLCHLGPTEVGAFAISAPDNLLYIEQVVTVKQSTTPSFVQFEDQAVANYFDDCVDQGLKPSQFARLWLHTHPAESALPSGTDEDTFQRVFGVTDWAVMAILSREGHSYARLRVNSGPGISCRLRWRVDWASWPVELITDSLTQLHVAWHEEYERNVVPQIFRPSRKVSQHHPVWDTPQLQDLDSWYGDPLWSNDQCLHPSKTATFDNAD